MAGNRPRIKTQTVGTNFIEDESEFVKNKCTERARRIITIQEELKFELWYDQHYIRTRHQYGEDNGEKRLGIEPEVVESLIKKSVNHLLYYSARVSGFSFLNHESNPLVRVVLQDSSEEDVETLNVIIEAHLLTIKTFEVTVKTVIRKNNFVLQDGQYGVEFLNEDSSLLKKQLYGKGLVEVLACEL